MENKSLLFRRILYLFLFVLLLVFMSFYGGNVPYMLFAALVINTIVSIVYILYVFFTIKIYQVVPELRVTKMEFVPYKLLLNNESVMAYRDVKLSFMTGLSEVKGVGKIGNVCLEPNCEIVNNMELFCKYSGTYYVGVDTIEIMDYFKIFKIRFHMPQKMKLTVKPRIIMPSSIAFITNKEECHNSSLKGNSKDLIDNEVHRYVPGDNKKLIHWKNSAKRRELMVRNMTAEEIFKYVVIMDGSMQIKDYMDKIIVCDKLRELTLALVNYMLNSKFYVEVSLDHTYCSEILSKRDFRFLSDRLVDYSFGLEKDFVDVLNTLNKKHEENVPFIVITANASGIDAKSLEEIRIYRNVHILDVNLFDDIEVFLNVEE